MLEKTIILNRANWLASEKNKVTKTITVSASHSYVVENDRKIVKSGTVFTSPYYGLLEYDVDITDGDQVAALMIAGYYFDEKLPASASSYVSNFAAQGLFPLKEGSATRPDFGTVATITTLGTPSVTVNTLTASWTAIPNAIGYKVYTSATENGNYNAVAELATGTTTYTASGACYIKIKALGDNINYADSVLSAAKKVTA